MKKNGGGNKQKRTEANRKGNKQEDEIQGESCSHSKSTHQNVPSINEHSICVHCSFECSFSVSHILVSAKHAFWHLCVLKSYLGGITIIRCIQYVKCKKLAIWGMSSPIQLVVPCKMCRGINGPRTGPFWEWMQSGASERPEPSTGTWIPRTAHSKVLLLWHKDLVEFYQLWFLFENERRHLIMHKVWGTLCV
jgi:hypothetical protein